MFTNWPHPLTLSEAQQQPFFFFRAKEVQVKTIFVVFNILQWTRNIPLKHSERCISHPQGKSTTHDEISVTTCYV